jgi:hypothetical protein
LYPLLKKLYRRTRRLRTIDEVEVYFPGFKAFIDSFEQEFPRPKNNRKRERAATTLAERRNTYYQDYYQDTIHGKQ